MKKVTITFDIEAGDYHNTPNTNAGVKKLVVAMFEGQADFPAEKDIKVESIPSKK